MFKKIILIFAVVLIWGSFFLITVAENKKGLRELLVNSENVNNVFAIDDFYTHVFPKIKAIGIGSGEIIREFTDELIATCDTKWEIKDIDPITSNESWVPYDGKSNIYYRVRKDKATQNNRNVFGSRCIERFEIVDVWGTQRSLFSDGTGKYFSPTNFIIKHSDAQQYVYKHEKIPQMGEVVVLPDGEIKSLSKSGGGFFSKLLNLNKPNSEELFQYSSALCKKSNGKVRLVTSKLKFVESPKGKIKRDGVLGDLESSLIEVDVFEGYKYVFVGNYTNTGSAKEWYLACEGQQPFVVKENEIISYGNKGEIISSSAIFVSNRGLEVVNYTPMKTK